VGSEMCITDMMTSLLLGIFRVRDYVAETNCCRESAL
jgi:hypothetical protein